MENNLRNEMSRAERFEIAFNQIHSRLKELTKNRKTDRFVDLLQVNSEKYSSIRENFSQLKQYAKLRNAIVHEKVDNGYYIAEPHEDIVEDIERISHLVYHPPSAVKLASKPVIFFDIYTSLQKVLSTIEKHGYSQFPVYEEGHFKGLLTEGGIAKWFSQRIKDGVITINNVRVADILELEKRRNVACLEKKSSVYDVENTFEEYYKKKQKLEAVILTENGGQDQAPIGIITSWDLVEFDHDTASMKT
ncbi:putative transcriptional regulator [Salirhabdus euzebyi]|uniref:Putative transcriptional regulator n=1 Tax=Salirhabdus euzebyi TaxID=394506 RepID=A0A841Q719_9BACI|nr:CBS domain-containing protein [Salirhabdus euzebyi]MBB6454210.1 putative transcriptional regulator [Salirhabdus euzebyi]